MPIGPVIASRVGHWRPCDQVAGAVVVFDGKASARSTSSAAASPSSPSCSWRRRTLALRSRASARASRAKAASGSSPTVTATLVTSLTLVTALVRSAASVSRCAVAAWITAACCTSPRVAAIAAVATSTAGSVGLTAFGGVVSLTGSMSIALRSIGVPPTLMNASTEAASSRDLRHRLSVPGGIAGVHHLDQMQLRLEVLQLLAGMRARDLRVALHRAQHFQRLARAGHLVRIRAMHGMGLLRIDAVGIGGAGIHRAVARRYVLDWRDRRYAELLRIGGNRRRGAAYFHESIIGWNPEPRKCGGCRRARRHAEPRHGLHGHTAASDQNTVAIMPAQSAAAIGSAIRMPCAPKG